jgi:hypothetical protein
MSLQDDNDGGGPRVSIMDADGGGGPVRASLIDLL